MSYEKFDNPFKDNDCYLAHANNAESCENHDNDGLETKVVHINDLAIPEMMLMKPMNAKAEPTSNTDFGVIS